MVPTPTIRRLEHRTGCARSRNLFGVLASRAWLIAAFLCAAALLPSTASAQPRDSSDRGSLSADDRLQRGLELFREEDYEGAASEFAAAHDLEQRPDILFAWAQAARLAGRCKLAARLYEQFMDSSPNEEDARAARKARGLCRDRTPPPAEDTAPRARKKKKRAKKRTARRRDREVIAEIGDIDDAEPSADETVAAEADAARWHSRRAVFARVHVDLAGGDAVASPGFSLRVGAPWRVFASALVGGNLGFEAGAELALGAKRVQPYVSVAIPVFFAAGARPGVRGGVGMRVGGKTAVTVELGGTYALSVPSEYVRTVLLASAAIERSF